MADEYAVADPPIEKWLDSAPELPRRALEQAGVEFIDPESGGPGMRAAGSVSGELVFGPASRVRLEPGR
jgi:hypothetical protein